MAARRIVYGIALAGAVAFYWASRNWLSAVLLIIAVAIPWLSLIVSLPAIFSCKAALQCPAAVTVGVPAKVSLTAKCRFPMPVVGGKLRLLTVATGKKKRLKPGAALPTEHCGAYRLQCRNLWAADYMGLIRLPVRLREDRLVLVRPVTILPEQLPDLSRYLCNITRPKPGGGYAENHELREYRPGDNLRQIHWKLSAKTGELIVREPMEAQQNAMHLTMELSGEPEVLDRKLGQLLGMSTYLAENNIKHRILCYTGKGMADLSVSNAQEALDAIDHLLQQPAAPEEEIPVYPKSLWRHHIGGGGSET